MILGCPLPTALGVAVLRCLWGQCVGIVTSTGLTSTSFHLFLGILHRGLLCIFKKRGVGTPVQKITLRYRIKCVKEHVFAEWDGGISAHVLVKHYSQVRTVPALIYCVPAHLAFVLPCFEHEGFFHIVDVLRQPTVSNASGGLNSHGESGKTPLCACFTVPSLEGDLIHRFSKNREKKNR